MADQTFEQQVITSITRWHAYWELAVPQPRQRDCRVASDRTCEQAFIATNKKQVDWKRMAPLESFQAEAQSRQPTSLYPRNDTAQDQLTLLNLISKDSNFSRLRTVRDTPWKCQRGLRPS